MVTVIPYIWILSVLWARSTLTTGTALAFCPIIYIPSPKELIWLAVVRILFVTSATYSLLPSIPHVYLDGISTRLSSVEPVIHALSPLA